MAPLPPIVVLDPLPWTRSIATKFALHELVNGEQLAANMEGAPHVDCFAGDGPGARPAVWLHR
jgi:hypothetical protein